MNSPTHLLRVDTTIPVRWRIHKTSPAFFDAKLCGYTLINPTFNASLNAKAERLIKFPQNNRVMLPSKDEVVFSSDDIYLMIPSDTDKDVFRDELRDKIVAEVSAFLLWIRFLSFQHEMPSSPSVIALGKQTVDTLAGPVFPDLSNAGKAFCRAYLITCCATECTAIEAARKVAAQDTVPVYHHLLIDAFSAFEAHDYRQCLLYAAIAMEALAASRLEQEYSARLSGSPEPDVRIIELPQAGGTTVRKDPVYDVLSTGTNFSRLLHERPLYLMGRSLLSDHPETYRHALMLYATRNKIGHRGELSEGNMARSFALNEEDAWVALCCVADIFRWFGEAPITYPDQSPIRLFSVDW